MPEVSSSARSRWRWDVFLGGWTVLVALAAWWMLRRTEAVGAASFIAGDAAANATLAERIGNWLKLADLSFHPIYPWILLAPYIAWLADRFLLERDRWRVSLPIHLSGCALFGIACHELDSHADRWRSLLVTVSAVAMQPSDDKTKPAGLTNVQVTIITNATELPRGLDIGQGLIGPGPNLSNFIGGGESGRAGGAASGAAFRREFVTRRHLLPGPFDVLNVFAYAGVVGLVQTVHSRRQSRERERRAAALEAQWMKARLNALQAQLHPHFLFNALNAISTLVRSDTRAAQDMLASFSELLRLALAYSTQAEVTLREDMEFLRRYVEIQQTRLGDRLRFEEEIAPDALDCLVPALLLQPLVENAIRHGIEPSTSPGQVRVVVRLGAGRLDVTVQDNGAGLSEKEEERRGGAGIGLQNLAARLETLYGAGQKLEFRARDGGGVVVAVEIPARRSPEAHTAATTS